MSDFPAPRLRLVTRADDAGSCSEANAAILQTVRAGFIRNVSIMIPGPAAHQLPPELVNRDDIDFGLHVTLNSEWETRRWGPILPPSDVPSLVLEDGNFTHSPHALSQHAFNPEEAIAEVAAQYARALDLGLRLQYLDEHMGVGWLPGLRERLQAFARSHNLLVVSSIPYLNGTSATPLDPAPTWKRCLENAGSGTFVLITHPGQDSGEMRHFFQSGGEPGRIARERAAETAALCDRSLQQWCSSAGVQPVRYTEILSLDESATGANGSVK